jgi:hypothetical protein
MRQEVLDFPARHGGWEIDVEVGAAFAGAEALKTADLLLHWPQPG